ncbi:MAG: 2,3-bisphosphoglycerate-independent phosphoglycerate mutase [Thermoplasmata archaeon]
MKRILLIVCDGLGDRPVDSFGGKTPLQAANKHNFDWFAENGICGLMDPIAPGVRPGSDTAHLAIFGYDPHECYTGRGPFEAVGAGLKLEEGDVAFRCNFATVDDDMKVIDRRAGRISSGTDEITSTLDGSEIGGAKIVLKPGTAHRAALILRGKGLSWKVSDADPHEAGKKVLDVLPYEEDAEKTAGIVNEFVRLSHGKLAGHPINAAREKEGKLPANIMLPRGGGIWVPLRSFKERYGLKAAAISGVTLVRGICMSLGMEMLEVEGATGGLDTDMIAKADAAMKALESKDFVYMNVKAPDICGHDGLADEKVKVIERLDEMLGVVKRQLDDETILAVTADHSTPIEVGDHSGDPVPLLIFGPGVRIDSVAQFDEVSVARGGLGHPRGSDLMNLLLNLAGRAEKFGA